MYHRLSEHIHVFGKVILKPEVKFSFLSYLITGPTNVLIDTVPPRSAEVFLAELQSVLPIAQLDAVILNHSEEDHSGALAALLELAPSLSIYCTPACKEHLSPTLSTADFRTVSSGEQLTIGTHRFQFTHTPGLHWNDNMVTYYENEGILFSNDLFGQSTGAEPPLDRALSEHEVLTAAKAYFDKVFTPATPEERRVVLTLPAEQLRCIAPGHGLILQKYAASVLDYYRTVCTA